MKSDKVFDQYETRSFGSEIVMYWRQLKPEETKTLKINLVQKFSGECYQKPHNAYLYYDNDKPVWVSL
jgi:hypothetical protein